MSPHAVLLRAVNVGGHGKIAMAELRDTLIAAGFGAVRTHIQSGNVVLDDPQGGVDLSERIHAALAERFGAAPEIIVLTPQELGTVLAACPFTDADPARVLALLHGGNAAPDAVRLHRLATATERWAAAERALWLHCPDGFGRSKLAAGAERAMGVAATGRNLRTLRALFDLVTETRP
ncbi:MAG: DUF1697 domain-containing protein [Pseudomonadota bacterium]